MVVIISWVAFWINRDSAPARVTLGIMTVLTMTTLMTTTNRQMPKVSYIKAVDIYLGVCYVMVFAALLEYAAVSYSNKKMQDRKRKRQSVQIGAASSAADASKLSVPPTGASGPDTVRQQVAATTFGKAATSSQDTKLRISYGAGRQAQPDVIGHMGFRAVTRNMTQPSQFQSMVYPYASSTWRFNFGPFRNMFRKMNIGGTGFDGNVSDKNLQLVASGIDKYSRAIFPLIFGIFNLIYWTVFLKQSGKI